MNLSNSTLNEINLEQKNIFNTIYSSFLLEKLKESEQDIKNGKCCSLKEFKNFIKELEEKNANTDN